MQHPVHNTIKFKVASLIKTLQGFSQITMVFLSHKLVSDAFQWKTEGQLVLQGVDVGSNKTTTLSIIKKITKRSEGIPD